MALRDGLFVAFSSAMLTVAFAPRQRTHSAAITARPVFAMQPIDFTVQTAWLAQRESAKGDWESVRPPLREGDEIQLTVLASEDADVYVLDGNNHQIFPPPGAPPSLAHVRAHWPYAIPGPHRTWRLDAAEHDKFWMLASRHPLADPGAVLAGVLAKDDELTIMSQVSDVELPLRDGRPGTASSSLLGADGHDTLHDLFDAR